MVIYKSQSPEGAGGLGIIIETVMLNLHCNKNAKKKKKNIKNEIKKLCY